MGETSWMRLNYQKMPWALKSLQIYVLVVDPVDLSFFWKLKCGNYAPASHFPSHLFLEQREQAFCQRIGWICVTNHFMATSRTIQPSDHQSGRLGQEKHGWSVERIFPCSTTNIAKLPADFESIATALFHLLRMFQDLAAEAPRP